MAEDLLYSKVDELRMPESTPGVPDQHGFVFYGPIGTGQVSVETAMYRAGLQGYLRSRSPERGAPMVNDPVLRDIDHGRGVLRQHDGIDQPRERFRPPAEPRERH